MIQSLENFFSMAIQGTQVRMYTKTRKQNIQVMQKQKQEGEREKKKSDRITWSLFPSIPWKNLSV